MPWKLPYVPSSNFLNPGLTHYSLILYKLIFINGEREQSHFILSHMDIQHFQHHFETVVLSPMFVLVFFFCQISVDHRLEGLVLLPISRSLGLCGMSLCQYHAVLIITANTILWHQTGSSPKREQQLSDCLQQVGLWVTLWGIFWLMIDVERSCPLWAMLSLDTWSRVE